MKRIISTIVLFVLLILTVFAINRIDTAKTSAIDSQASAILAKK